MKVKKLMSGLVLFGATLALVACGNNSSKTEESSSMASSSMEASSTTETASSSMMASWKDGTYKGESGYDNRGWKAVHSITIKDGKITESNFGYEDKDGNKKADDAEYNKGMKEKSGITSKEATDKLNAELVKTQNVADVEVVSGATHTSENFTAATKALLAAAEEGKTDPVMFELDK